MRKRDRECQRRRKRRSELKFKGYFAAHDLLDLALCNAEINPVWKEEWRICALDVFTKD